MQNMKISEIIAKEDCLDSKKVEILKESIRSHIDNSARNQNETATWHATTPISPAQLKHFFRNKEREENTGRLLQYLLMFTEKAPVCEKMSPELITPEKQLREFVSFQLDLLREKDVKKAILRETSQLGILRTGNFWYYEGRIADLHKELSEALAACPDQGPAAIITLCRILEKLSLFWFDICREDACRVRVNDIFIYKLTLILKKKWNGYE